MQITLAALEKIFGHQKKALKYLRRLLISKKPCPILYLFSQKDQATDFGAFVLSLASLPEVATKIEARKKADNHFFSYQTIQKLTPQILEGHLVARVRGIKAVVICEHYPWSLLSVQDEAVAFFEIEEFDLQAVLQEIKDFASLLLKKTDFDGKPNSEFRLGI